MFSNNDNLFLKTQDAKREYEYYRKRYNDLIASWFEIGKNEIPRWEGRDTVKNLNTLNEVKKKKVILGVFMESSTKTFDGLYNITQSSHWKTNEWDNISFGFKDYDGRILIASKSNPKELKTLYSYLLTEEAWKYSIKKDNTKLGYKDWVNKFSLNKLKSNNKPFERDEYSESFYKIFKINSIRIPKLISKEYLIAYDDRTFKKSLLPNNSYNFGFI